MCSCSSWSQSLAHTFPICAHRAQHCSSYESERPLPIERPLSIIVIIIIIAIGVVAGQRRRNHSASALMTRPRPLDKLARSLVGAAAASWLHNTLQAARALINGGANNGDDWAIAGSDFCARSLVIDGSQVAARARWRCVLGSRRCCAAAAAATYFRRKRKLKRNSSKASETL